MNTERLTAARLKPGGFTLIELLIVVAIIAILALIAVPNLLEAQVRAKVARVKSDLRTVATAVEAYAVDRGDYPRNFSYGAQTIPPDLTTPVPYLTTTILYDPFATNLIVPGYRGPEKEYTAFYSYHRIVTLAEAARFRFDSPWNPDATSIDHPLCNPGAFRKYGQWLLHSIGPDRVWDSQGDWLSHDTLYDPTNGTVSFGNIVRTQLDPEGRIR